MRFILEILPSIFFNTFAVADRVEVTAGEEEFLAFFAAATAFKGAAEI